MKKGLLLTLTAAAVSFSAAPAVHALAPTITDPGDVIVGDAEHGAASNEFVFEDAINLGVMADDDNVTTPNIQWSYFIAPDPTEGVVFDSLNGAAVLGVNDVTAAVAAPAGSQIQDAGNADGDGDNVEDADPFTVTFRNTFLSASGAGFNTDPGVSGIVTTQTQAVTLFVSDGTTASSKSFVVYTANDTSDSTGVNLELLDDFDYTDPNTPEVYTGWLGGVLGGTGTTSAGAPTGLCIGAPLLGNNTIAWVYIGGRQTTPTNGGMIKLVDGNVWQFRAQISSTAPGPDQTPLLDVSFDNTVAEYLNGGPSPSDPFPVPTEGLTYATEHIVLDNSGGANAIDQPTSGNDTIWQYWLAPGAMQLPQWRGLIDGPDSAFDPSTDDSNDMNPTFRILDFDGAGLNAQIDTGTLCLERVSIYSAPLTSLRGGQTALLGLPIRTENYAPVNSGQAGQPGTAVIDNTTQVAFYKLINGDAGGSPPGTAKTFFPYVVSRVIPPGNFANGDHNPALYPVPWTANTLYLTEVDIRSGVGGSAAAPNAGTVEGTAPVDVIQINSIPPTTELVSQAILVHGSAGTMRHATSPRLSATLVAAGLAQDLASANQFYVGITHGQNGTNADVTTPSIVAHGDALQPTCQFLNGNPAILGAGTDEFAMHSIEVYSLGQFAD